MSRPKAVNGFLCDDIRRENNGKLIAIGIFSKKILVNNFPCGLIVHALVNIVFDAVGDTVFKIRLTVDGQMRSEAEVGARVESVGADWVPIPLGLITFERPSRIALSYLTNNSKWKVFHEIPIEHGPPEAFASLGSISG